MTAIDRSGAHADEHLSLVRDIAFDETHVPPTAVPTILSIETPPTSAPLWCPKMTENIRVQLNQFTRIGVMDAEDIALYSHCWHWLGADGLPTNTPEGERHCIACGTIALCPWCCPPPSAARAAIVLLMECPACKALMRERTCLEERLRGVVLLLQRRCALAMPPLFPRTDVTDKEAHA